MSAIDIILVRYCPTREDQRLWNGTLAALSSQPVNVLWRDNTKDNIGLVAARNELVKQSKAPIVVFMDFDFERIDVDFHAMSSRLGHSQVGMVVPYSQQANTGRNYPGFPTRIGSLEWQEITRVACNCMMLPREIFDRTGGFYAGYHTACADTELVHQVQKIGLLVIQHNASGVVHVSRSKAANPEKQKIWDHDHAIYHKRHTALDGDKCQCPLN
jgi:hypothetical protein